MKNRYTEAVMYTITTFYKFLDLSDDSLVDLQHKMQKLGREMDLRGLTRIAQEGVNGTIGGSGEEVTKYKAFLTETFGEILFKDSQSDSEPFKRFYVKIRDEIVTIKNQRIEPHNAKRTALTPKEWNAMINQNDTVLLDARNGFEVDLGAFEGAIDMRLRKFSEFEEKVQESGIPKDKKVLMYCTGGIRCEKAEHVMRSLGYDHVYQLDGGILKYLEQCPGKKFEGECFVFDKRVAVDQHLNASKRYALCPHCGDPGDREITCELCGSNGKLCSDCLSDGKEGCTKDCDHRIKRKRAKAI